MEATSRRSVTSSAHFKSAAEIGQTAAFIPGYTRAMIIGSRFLRYSGLYQRLQTTACNFNSH